MTKLRIIKRGNFYYPQYKFFFIWWNFTEGYSDSDVRRSSLEQAEDYINKIISAPPITTEVIKEYNL